MIRVGEVTIEPVFEVDGGEVIQEGIPAATPNAAKAISWLAPHYAAADGKLKAAVWSFVIRLRDLTIVVDTGVGDGRNRPAVPVWANLRTGFLERFTKVCDPSSVDIVLNTHMHFDHVGWNVTLVDGQPTPTFPNAKYIFVEPEFSYWKSKPAKELDDDRWGFAECVLSIHEAGLSRLVPADHHPIPEITFLPTPGHTPGHVSFLIESQGQSAVISGDALHHPCQIAHADWGTPFDTDTNQANASRAALLERFADTDTIFIGTHFAEPVSGKIVKDGQGYKLI